MDGISKTDFELLSQILNLSKSIKKSEHKKTREVLSKVVKPQLYAEIDKIIDSVHTISHSLERISEILGHEDSENSSAAQNVVVHNTIIHSNKEPKPRQTATPLPKRNQNLDSGMHDSEFVSIVRDKTFIRKRSELIQFLKKYLPDTPLDKKDSMSRIEKRLVAHFSTLSEQEKKRIMTSVRRLYLKNRTSSLGGWSEIISSSKG